jgi:peptide deformylase
MAIRDILMLGNEDLYSVSREVSLHETLKIQQVVEDLRDTMLNFRINFHFGRAISAPQIGEFVRIIYMNFDNQVYVMINPTLEFGSEQFEVWDDCMSFPGLEVKLNRYRRTRMRFKDLHLKDCVLDFHDDLSELVQHEYDHLDGILAVQRALTSRSFRINRQKAGAFFPSVVHNPSSQELG